MLTMHSNYHILFYYSKVRSTGLRSFGHISVLLALGLPHLGKRDLILVLFVRLFDLRLFGFVCFLFLSVYGKGCGL